MEQNKTMIFAIRIFHIVVTLFLLASIIYLYYAAFTKKFDWFLGLPLGALIIEALFLIYNRGKCPLGKIHAKYGDEKGFWDLFLPNRIVPAITLFLEIVTVIGFVLVFLSFIGII